MGFGNSYLNAREVNRWSGEDQSKVSS